MKGALRFSFTLFGILTIHFARPHEQEVDQSVSCDSLQFCDVGKVGFISCVFSNYVTKIFWFKKEEDSLLSLVSYESGEKDGDGFTSGEYDIFENGSLIIKNVSLYHDGQYKVKVLDDNDKGGEAEIELITIGSPEGQRPSIDICDGQLFCIAEYKENQNISCSFTTVQPALELKWYRVYHGRKENIGPDEGLLADESSTIATVLMSNLPKRILTVLSCEASWRPLHSTTLSATVVLDNSNELLPLNKTDISFTILPEFIYAEFFCGDINTSLISVWKIKKAGGLFQTIAYNCAEEGYNYTISSVSYNAAKWSLIFQPVKETNEGTYLCMTSDGFGTKYAFTRLRVHKNESVGCMSPQYSETEKRGFIYCNFPAPFVSVYWHYELDGTSKPLASYEKSKNTANQRDSQLDTDYQVSENGSLVINRVKINDEGNYRARVLTPDDKLFTFDVNLMTTVNPKKPFPIVNACDGKEFCLIDYEEGKSLECRLDNVRPRANLLWYIKTSTREKESLNQPLPVFVNGEQSNFSTIVNLPLSAFSNNVLQMLLCQATWPSLNSRPLISHVMIANIDNLLSFHKDSVVSVDLLEKTETKITCTYKKRHFIFLWKFSPRYPNIDFRNLAYTFRSEDEVFTFSEESVSILKYSSLSIGSVDMSHTGVYMCIASDGKNHSVSLYNVTVIRPPTPRCITVEQCYDENSPCQINSPRGFLACHVSYVYPAIQLEIVADDSDRVKIFNTKTSTDKSDGSFNVSVRAEYEAVLTSRGQNISLSCLASGKAATAFKKQKKIFLVLSDTAVKEEQPTDEPVTSNITWYKIPAKSILIITVLILLIFTFCLVMCVCVCVEKGEKEPPQKKPKKKKKKTGKALKMRKQQKMKYKEQVSN